MKLFGILTAVLSVALTAIACAPSETEIQKMVNAEAAKIELPAGPPGPQGERGEPGPQGIRGAQGEVSDERLAAAIQSALETVEFPQGPPGPRDIKGFQANRALPPKSLVFCLSGNGTSRMKTTTPRLHSSNATVRPLFGLRTPVIRETMESSSTTADF